MVSEFRRRVLDLLYPAPVIDEPAVVIDEPDVTTRHAQPTKVPKRRPRRRATIPAKDLAPETKNPSPE